MLSFGAAFWGCLISCSQTSQDKSGQQVYQTYCSHCHQSNGNGIAGRYPPLAGSEWLDGEKPIKIIVHGLQGKITVKGAAYNNIMAPWGDVLTDAEIAGVINHIRSSWENKEKYILEPSVHPQDVQQVRVKYPKKKSWKPEEL